MDPVLFVLHELAHAVALNAHPEVENAFIRSEKECYCVGTRDVHPQALCFNRTQVVRMLAAGITAEWLYRFRAHDNAALMTAALFHGRLDMWLESPGADCDGRQLVEVMQGKHQDFTQAIYELARTLWPIVAGCDEIVCRETMAMLEALPIGGELEFDTGHGLLALAGVKLGTPGAALN